MKLPPLDLYSLSFVSYPLMIHGIKFPILWAFSSSFSSEWAFGILKQPTGKALTVLLYNVRSNSRQPDKCILWASFSMFTFAVTLENRVHTPAALPSDSRHILGGNSAEIRKNTLHVWHSSIHRRSNRF